MSSSRRAASACSTTALLAGILAACARRRAAHLLGRRCAGHARRDRGRRPTHPLRAALAELDLVLTYGGGDPVVNAYRGFGATHCVPVYNALDPETHHPVPPDARYAADAELSRQSPAGPGGARGRVLLRCGAASAGGAVPARRRGLGRQARAGQRREARPCAHRSAQRAQCQRPLGAEHQPRQHGSTGFSPATRVFEAAGAGACLFTDAWEGIGLFLTPGEEVLVVRDGADLAEALRGLGARRVPPRSAPPHCAGCCASTPMSAAPRMLDRLLRDALAKHRAVLAA